MHTVQNELRLLNSNRKLDESIIYNTSKGGNHVRVRNSILLKAELGTIKHVQPEILVGKGTNRTYRVKNNRDLKINEILPMLLVVILPIMLSVGIITYKVSLLLILLYVLTQTVVISRNNIPKLTNKGKTKWIEYEVSRAPMWGNKDKIIDYLYDIYKSEFKNIDNNKYVEHNGERVYAMDIEIYLLLEIVKKSRINFSDYVVKDSLITNGGHSFVDTVGKLVYTMKNNIENTPVGEYARLLGEIRGGISPHSIQTSELTGNDNCTDEYTNDKLFLFIKEVVSLVYYG